MAVYSDILQFPVLYGSVLWYIAVKVVTLFQMVIINNLPYALDDRIKSTIYSIYYMEDFQSSIWYIW